MHNPLAVEKKRFTQSNPAVPRYRAACFAFFLISGATSLALEVVWTRMLGAVFGNTVLAASTVVTAFMLGLALGSAMLGRWADRCRQPLVRYGCLEIGVGFYAFLFPLLTAAAGSVYGWFFRTFDPGAGSLNAVRFILSVVILVPPTFLMGGTLPVLGRHLGVGLNEPGREIGFLYGVNTAGGVLGCFLSGFVLLEAFGIRGTLRVAGGAAIAIGFLALWLGRQTSARPTAANRRTRVADPDSPALPDRRRQAPAPERSQAAPGVDPVTFQLVLVAFGLTGFCALAFQVLWTRILLFLLTTTVYAFAAMLTAFLVGIALGTAFSARFLVPRLRRPVLWFGVIEVLVGLAGLASVPALAHLNTIDTHLSQYFRMGGVVQLVLTYLSDTFVVLLGPTFLMGVAFPIVTTGVLRGELALGRRLGQIYAANTVGCVLGSWMAGFVLIPLLGVHRSLLSVAALNSLVGIVMILHASGQFIPQLESRLAASELRPSRAPPGAPHAAIAMGAGRLGAACEGADERKHPRRSAPLESAGPSLQRWMTRLGLPAALLALIVAAFRFTPSDIFHQTINLFHQPSRIIFIQEDPTATVTVHELSNQNRILAVDGVDVAGLDLMLRTTQKLQAYIPLCLHPNPKRVVQIGFGSGETARVGLDFGVENYTVVEICPAVFAAGPYFESINRGSYRDPRLHKVIMDGKNFALLTRQKFDIVMNDSIFPGSSGSAALYTIDHFRQCRERLADGGLFSCWVPLDLRPSELRMILKSFQAVFPHTSVWVASNTLNKQGLILGSLAPLRIDFQRLKSLLARPEIQADLRAIAIHDVYDFLDGHMCDAAAIRSLVEKDPFNSDDQPRLEFSCALRVPWPLRLRQTLAMLTAFRAPIAASVDHFENAPHDQSELARRFESTTHLFRAQVAQLAGSPKIRRQELDQALQLSPNDPQVKSCEEELETEIRDLQDASARNPAQRVFALRLAEKLFIALRYEEAARLYEGLMDQRPPPTASAFAHLAEIRFQFADAADAERWLRRGLEDWPNSAEIHDLLGGLCWRSGRTEEAQQHSAKAIRLEPGNPLFEQHHNAVMKDAQPK